MEKEIIRTEQAPAAIGPYSQAVRVGDTVWLSGQIPLVPDSMQLVEGGFEAQAVQVFDNLDAVVRAAGATLADIVKLNIYLQDIADFPVVNQVMSRYFDEPYPARAAMQVAALPKGAAIEADCVLYMQRGS